MSQKRIAMSDNVLRFKAGKQVTHERLRICDMDKNCLKNYSYN